MKRFVSVLALLLFAGLVVSHAQDTARSPANVEVCYRKTSMLVFPSGIEAADFGSSDILGKVVKKGSNVLKVKAAKQAFDPTNLTVFTSDGRLYSLNVQYNNEPGQQVYLYADPATIPAIAYHPDTLSPANVQMKADFLSKVNHRDIVAKTKSQSIYLLLRQMYVSAGKMYFVFQLFNSSNIPFTIQYTRFFQQDAKAQKLSSRAQQEMPPLLTTATPGCKVIRYQPVTFVAAFNQFTIAHKKRFVIHIGEMGGDRRQQLVLKGKKILRAKKL
ncbi:DUF4138 domain-containing protein [Niastella sp. OAS944]|uniref:DUF4138 domain-containing protein n=1 Tax=Niastella sp. OAS944 TaxID=2664089 RepID=UPI00347EE278|nr:conjugative transposon TraN protein [Chitinophagaceae bacterium OAS944]